MTALSLIRSRNAKWRRRSATSASSVCETVAILTRRGVGDDSAASFGMIVAFHDVGASEAPDLLKESRGWRWQSGTPNRSQQPVGCHSLCVGATNDQLLLRGYLIQITNYVATRHETFLQPAYVVRTRNARGNAKKRAAEATRFACRPCARRFPLARCRENRSGREHVGHRGPVRRGRLRVGPDVLSRRRTGAGRLDGSRVVHANAR